MKYFARFFSHRQSGYTLIEILIATSLFATLAGAGIAAFTTFNDRQATLESAKAMQGWLRAAQTKAQALEKPSGCNQLHSYRFTTVDESNQVTLTAICNSSNQLLGTQTFTLAGGVVADVSTTLDFLVLRGGLSINGGASPSVALIVKKLGGITYRYSFTVTQGGEIREGKFL